MTSMPPPPRQQHTFSRMRDRGYAGLGDNSPPDSPRQALASISCPPLPSPPPGKPIPPPIDPGVFRSVATIRRLIDEASELAVRASSGMSAAALGSMRNGASPNLHSSPWALAQSLGMNPLGETGGGRNVAMSAMRIHRLRALAVQKLAAAYRADEIASSVMVMQGGSVFEDIAERVLKVGASADPFSGVFPPTLDTDPNDADAKYVHFFHEKIPSRFVVIISALYVAYVYWERADNSRNVQQLAFSTNSSKPSPNVSSSFARGASSVHSGTSMEPLSKILPMR